MQKHDRRAKRGGKTRWRSASRYRTGLTAIETAGDAGDDDLEGEETAHAEEDITVLLVDGVDADDVDEGAGGEEDGGADGLEEEEVGALLETELAQFSLTEFTMGDEVSSAPVGRGVGRRHGASSAGLFGRMLALVQVSPPPQSLQQHEETPLVPYS